MANPQIAQPLVSRALPQSGAARWVAYTVLAFVGALLITLAGQIKVPFWPVPISKKFAPSLAVDRSARQ